jgi:DNA polymerase III epsilon subunit-like protein
MIVFDTETTGLPKPAAVPLIEQPKIIEFAAIKLDDKTLKEVGRMEFLCNPQERLDPFIIKNCHITDEMLADKPPFVYYYPQLVEFFFGTRKMAAHNIGFDRDLLTFELMRLDRMSRFPWPPEHICTVEASYAIKNHRLKLSLLHEIVTGKPHKDAHRAMADTEALVTCIRWLRKKGMGV